MLESLVRSYLTLKKQEEKLRKRREEISKKIMELVKDKGKLKVEVDGKNFSVKITHQTREYLNLKELSEDYPEVYGKYVYFVESEFLSVRKCKK